MALRYKTQSHWTCNFHDWSYVMGKLDVRIIPWHWGVSSVSLQHIIWLTMSFCLGSRNCLQVALMWHTGKHALTFLVWKNDTYKKLSDESLAWLSARCKNEIVRMWFGWCHCYPKISSSPASLNFRIIFLIPSCPWPGKDITKCVFSVCSVCSLNSCACL